MDEVYCSYNMDRGFVLHNNHRRQCSGDVKKKDF